MPSEIVLTSQDPVTPDALATIATDIAPGGLAVQLLDGELVVVIDGEGQRVLTMFASKQIERAAAVLGHDLQGARWWTSIAVPFGAPEQGTAIALELAGATGATATLLS